jgi:hypothetical protein
MKQKSIPSSWVKEKNDLLRSKLPKDVQESPFYPDVQFYAQYYKDNLKGLHYMAGVLFSWLKIAPNGCTVDFYDEKEFKKFAGDTAGFYTKIKNDKGEGNEVILINSKHKANPLAVGAILAHEMMHLYLFRLNLKLEDVQENELLTDLATINTGLAILILNGMTYSSQWYLTIIMAFFGRIYWRSQQLAFGYFKPKEYGYHAMAYFNEHNLSAQHIIGYLNPTSRHFIPHAPFLKGKNTTEYIKLLDKEHKKSNLKKWAIVAPFVIIIGYFWISGSVSSSNQSNLSNQIDTCQAAVTALGNQANTDQTTLDNMDTQMTQYQNEGDNTDYNNLVDPYNSLLAQVKQESANYETQRANCNNLVDQYNQSVQ